jgi:hypothetical protein
MAIDRVAGHPNYAGVNDYIIPVYSAKTLKKFYEYTVLNEVTNTEYLGEIKNAGDTVIIRTEPDLTIRDYKKGQDLLLENPESPSIELVIKYAKYYNFGIDDVDEKQFDIKWMSKWSDNAAKRLKITIETELLTAICAETFTQSISSYNKGATAGKISGNINLGAMTGSAGLALTRTNILDYFVYINQVLDEQNLPDDGSRWVILPAWAASLIKLSDLKDASFTGLGQSTLLNGRVGKIDGVTIYKSNLLPTGSDGTRTCTYLPFGTKDALAFATQFTKTEMYRPEKTFASAIKGLQVYGCELVLPQCMGKMVVYKG